MAKRVEILKAASAAHYYTVEEAAIYLSITSPVLRNYLSEGKLKTYKFKTLTLVNITEAEEWLKNLQRG